MEKKTNLYHPDGEISKVVEQVIILEKVGFAVMKKLAELAALSHAA